MKRGIKKPQARAAIAIATTMLAAAAAAGATLTSTAATNSSQDPIQTDILKAVRLHANSATHSQWEQSGFTSDDIFSNIEAQNTQRDLTAQEAWESACQALSRLREPDLSLFQPQIEEHRAQLSCAPALLGRLEAYWQQNQELLSRFRGDTRIWHESLTLGEAPFKEKEAAPAHLPSIEVKVDASKGPVFYNGGLGPKQIAITFDDGPHPVLTQKLLAILKAYGVRSNFFEVGRNASAYSDISRQVSQAGHIVGSHTIDHANLPKLDIKSAENEIAQGRDMVAHATGVDIPFFRFPYGAHTPELRDFARSEGLATFYWNMDSLDWKIPNLTKLYRNVVSQLDLYKQGIILFHDIHPQSIEVMPHVLELLRERGYTTVVFVPK